MLFVRILLFIIGFVLIIFGGNFFVDSAVRIAKRLKMSEILIGATIVSIGTTLPELLTSSMAAAVGQVEMAAGNAIGSVICNTALIAGLVQAIRPSKFDYPDFRRSILIFFLAVAMFAIFAYSFGEIGLYAGILLSALFVFYIVFNVVMSRRKEKQLANEPLAPLNTEATSGGSVDANADGDKEQTCQKDGFVSDIKNKISTQRQAHPNVFTLLDIVILVASAAVLYFGTKLLIDNGIKIAETIGISERVISLIFIAIGTSLPELVTAITSLIKKHSAISLGNIIGANTLNILLVVGVSALIKPLPMDTTWLYIHLPVMAAVTLIFALPALITKKMHRWQGFLLLAGYISYAVYSLVAGA